MARINLKITNAQGLYDKFRRYGDNFRDAIQEDIDVCLDHGVEQAKSELYPGHGYKTGYMQGHITQSKVSKWGWIMRSEAKYSSFQEFDPPEGIRKDGGLHFMEHGAKVAFDEIDDMIKKNMKPSKYG